MNPAQAFTPVIVPLLNDELKALFLRLAMEMAIIVQGDEREAQSEIHEDQGKCVASHKEAA